MARPNLHTSLMLYNRQGRVGTRPSAVAIGDRYSPHPSERGAGRVDSDRLTFFHSAATCLHVPTELTPESAKHEGRKPRASERHVVGCCEVLAARS